MSALPLQHAYKVNNYEVVYAAICGLGGARLDRIAKECGLSRSTVSRAIRELDMDYMIRLENKVWRPTSAMPKTLGQACANRAYWVMTVPALPPGNQKLLGGGLVDQNADLPDVMKHIVDDLVIARTEHNRLEGVRTMRAKISRKKRRKNLLDIEVTHDLSVLARLLWVAMKTTTWETDPNFRVWLTADMNRLVPGWRKKVYQAVVEIGEAA